MTLTQLVQYVGKEASLSIHPLSIRVKITDVKQAFGRLDCLVSPVAGTGKQWVSVERLTFGLTPIEIDHRGIPGHPNHIINH